MKFVVSYIIIVISLFVFSNAVYGQVYDDGLNQDSTLLEEDIYFAEPGVKNEEGFFAMFEGDPGRAALYSAIIPGAGQIYNKKWLKAPVVWGLEGTAIVLIGYFNREYKCYDLAFKGLVRGEITSAKGFTDAAGVQQIRNDLKRNRDYSIIGLTVIHVLNIADAFVDRHLIEFDVDEDISINFGPTPHGIGLTMAFH